MCGQKGRLGLLGTVAGKSKLAAIKIPTKEALAGVLRRSTGEISTGRLPSSDRERAQITRP